MTNQEKQELLDKLKQDLEEAETERKFMQSQTGHHVSRDLRDKYEKEVILLRKRISELVETLLSK